MKTKKYIGVGILSLFLFLFGLSGIAVAQTTIVSISPSTQTVPLGQTFTIDITIDPDVAIAGAQFDLSFDPSLVRANSIMEGNLLKQGGASTYFSLGTIDNTAGAITGVAGAIITPGQTVSSPGVFATIQMTAKSVEGTSPLDLLNVIVGDRNGNPVSITVNNGSVTIGVSPTPSPTPTPTPTATPSPSPTPTPSPSPTPTPTPTPTPGATTVSITPPAQTVSSGQTFTVNITVDPAVPIAGVQFDLSFNASLISANAVTEGNLLKQGGANTYFSPGTIDNTTGRITGVAGAIITPGQTVSSPGVFVTIQMTAKSVGGSSTLDLSNVIVGDINGNPVPITVNNGSVTVGEVGYFDTGPGTYPSIPGTHTGDIIPSQDITVHKIYTYPCAGTGGHTEYVRIWNGTWAGKEAHWSGYQHDWHNITFDEPFMLFAKRAYHYEIITGSYPQIIHKPEHTTLDGSYINCTSFIDANGKTYTDWIPAIRIE